MKEGDVGRWTAAFVAMALLGGCVGRGWNRDESERITRAMGSGAEPVELPARMGIAKPRAETRKKGAEVVIARSGAEDEAEEKPAEEAERTPKKNERDKEGDTGVTLVRAHGRRQ